MLFQFANKSFLVSKPMEMQSPKRMYIIIPSASAADVSEHFNLQTAMLNGSPITGYEKVIAIVQTGESVRISLGGKA